MAHCRAWRRVQRAAAELDAAEEECQGRAREVASAEDALQLEVQRFPEGPQEAPQSSRMFLPFGTLLGDKELDFDMGDYLSAERVAELSAEDAEELERRKTAFCEWTRKAARVAFATTVAHLPETGRQPQGAGTGEEQHQTQ